MFRNRCRLAVWFSLLLIAIGAGAICPSAACASGAEWSGAEKDLQVAVDYRWAGCRVGGYYPIRLRMTNRGPTRTVTVRFEPSLSGNCPTVTRSVKVNQNATAAFSLMVPMVGTYGHGYLNFNDENDELKTLRSSIALPESELANPRPSLLVIARQIIDPASFDTAVASVYGATSSHHRSYGSSSDHEIVPPTNLPDSWLAYSGVDFVAIEHDALDSISNDSRAALTKWAHAGGTLIVYSANSDEVSRDEIDRLLDLAQSADARGWQAADRQLRVPLSQILTVDAYGNAITDPPKIELPQADVAEPVPNNNGEPVPNQETLANDLFVWKEGAFEVRTVGFGHVVVFHAMPFRGSPHDWSWLFNSVGSHNTRQAYRLGVAGRSDNEEFLNFLIPGIRSIPPTAFLIFISVFTFVIGPMNYFFLAKRKRLNLLVVTIPVVALATSVVLFGYSAIAHGFSIKSRLRSVTIIDQGTNTAVSTTRMALYAGLAPSNGLQFSTDTAVIPIWPSDTTFEHGSVDWTKGQSLRSGWLRSRTHTQVLMTTVRPERGRLAIESTPNGADIKNGLEWHIDALLVVDDAGRKFFGENIPAGASNGVHALLPADSTRFQELMARSTPMPPDEIDNLRDARMLNDFVPRSRRYYWDQNAEFRASSGATELMINHIANQHELVDALPKRTYYALVKNAPGIEMGIEEVEVIDEWHLVIGRY